MDTNKNNQICGGAILSLVIVIPM